MPRKRNIPDFEPLLSTQQNQLAMVVSGGDGIDNKALALLATNVTVLIFIAQASLEFSAWWHYVPLITPFVVSIIFTLLAAQPKSYLGASIVLEEHPEYLALKREELILQLLADTQEAIAHNKRINSKHWRYFLLSLVSAIVGIVVLFAILTPAESAGVIKLPKANENDVIKKGLHW
jgi:hypothetical protein